MPLSTRSRSTSSTFRISNSSAIARVLAGQTSVRAHGHEPWEEPAGPAPAAVQVEFDRGAPIGILRAEDVRNCSISAQELTFLTVVKSEATARET